jgi:hypothetical protein
MLVNEIRVPRRWGSIGEEAFSKNVREHLEGIDVAELEQLRVVFGNLALKHLQAAVKDGDLNETALAGMYFAAAHAQPYYGIVGQEPSDSLASLLASEVARKEIAEAMAWEAGDRKPRPSRRLVP